MNREAIWTAAFDHVRSLAAFAETDRKVKHWADCTNFPALYLNQGTETVVKTGRGLPSVYTMTGEIYLYVRNESNGTPATQVNTMLDLVEAAFPSDGKLSLGGLVEDCWIEGSIARDEGVLGDVGVAIVPIKILVTG